MCLAIPAKVIGITGEDQARIDIVGVQKDISTALIDNVVVGDYLIVHVGHAIGRIDADEAQKTLAYLAEMSDEDAKALAAAAM
jgi:hydrogenase expression/formation protein HypC